MCSIMGCRFGGNETLPVLDSRPVSRAVEERNRGLRAPFGNQIRILQPKAWQG
jgi:hypothetical protein